jgi:hypothetical protein
MLSIKSMKINLKEFLSIPYNSSKDGVVKWLFKKYLYYDLFIIFFSILLFSIIYLISSSLINYFSIVLTLFLILCLNATYFLYIMTIVIFFRNSRLDIANSYFIKKSFGINLIFSAIILITFSTLLIIFKFV